MKDFPYPLVTVHGSRAEAELIRLRHSGAREGFVPIIIGDQEEVDRVKEAFGFNEQPVNQILEDAAKIQPEEWFRKQAEELGGVGEEEEGEQMEEEMDEPSGSDRLTVPFDVLSQNPHTKVFIAQLPAAQSWEAPAYLKAGGWNECPEAAVQVAVSRYWQERYGAELACLSGDVAEYLVSRPPADKAGADALAREQAIYCGDIVDQGMGTVANLSKVLLGSKYWYFWWD